MTARYKLADFLTAVPHWGQASFVKVEDLSDGAPQPNDLTDRPTAVRVLANVRFHGVKHVPSTKLCNSSAGSCA